MARRWREIRDPATPLLVSLCDGDATRAAEYGSLGARVTAPNGPGFAQLRLWIAEVLALCQQRPAGLRREVG